MAEIREVLVPDIGDFADVPVIEVLVSPGDSVAAEDPLVTLESDKATMDVPAPFGGTVAEIEVSVGDTVSEGSPILTLEVRANGEPAQAGRRPRPPSQAGAVRTAEQAESAAERRRVGDRAGVAAGAAVHGEDGAPPYASPAVRRLARELGVDLSARGGLRPQEPDHQGGRARGRRGRAPQPAARRRRAGRRAGPGAVAEGGLREVRARSSAGRSRASRRSAARTWPATG